MVSAETVRNLIYSEHTFEATKRSAATIGGNPISGKH